MTFLSDLNKIINSYPQRISDLYSEKLRLYKLKKSHPHLKDVTMNYKNVSRELKKHLDKFRDETEIKVISSGQNSLNRYIKNKPGSNIEIPSLIDLEGSLYINKKTKCELFAKIFQKIFEEKPVNIINDNNNQMTNNQLSDIEINLGVIRDILKKLPGRNLNSPDNIPYILLKKCSDQLTII